MQDYAQQLLRLAPGGQQSCLNRLRLPARLTEEETAELIGCKKHDVPVLVKNRLLKPLGGGPKNSVKYFASCEVLKKSEDVGWLDKATRAIRSRTGKPMSNDAAPSRD